VFAPIKPHHTTPKSSAAHGRRTRSPGTSAQKTAGTTPLNTARVKMLNVMP